MMEVLRYALLAVTVCVVAVVTAPAPASKCLPDKLTVYKVVFHTFWSRDRFPKHYPDWRPAAQWSKLIGRSHDGSFTLFRFGQPASLGVKVFTETGRTEALEAQSQGEDGVYDEFSAPAMGSGVGRAEAEFFVDGNHSRVSLMARIIPSPDWFVGLDSFDLCVDGGWLDTITVEADPLDAGTDNGFTFTAPDWATEPQGTVYRITSKYPSHPAGSFYYPYIKRLPAIATFQFIKIKEYELSEVFHHDEDKDHFEVMRGEPISHNEIPGIAHNSDIEEQIEVERREEEMRRFTRASTLDPNAIVPTTPLLPFRHATTTVEPDTQQLPTGKTAVLNSIVQIYSHDSPGKQLRASKLHRTMRKFRAPRDCRVSDWREWGPCSKSCGIGEMHRRREVTKHARRGGRACPPLLETKWCGSARSCSSDTYFNW